MKESADLARLLRLTLRSVEREMMAGVAKAGLDMLTPQHLTVLRVLDPGTQGMRIVDLARDADVTRQAIQQVVAQLEQLGIVESLADPSDGRARRVRYTARGRAGYRRCLRELTRIEHEHEQRIGPMRLNQLKTALRELAADPGQLP